MGVVDLQGGETGQKIQMKWQDPEKQGPQNTWLNS